MHNPENERIKRAYFIYLKEARRLGEHSIDGAAAALAKFEDYTKYRDFKRFHIQQAIGFKSRLPNTSARARVNGSAEAVFSTLNALRAFFHWLSTQPGYRSHLTSADAEYFALSDKEAGSPRLLPSGRYRPSIRSGMCWRPCLPPPISSCAIGQ
jgi:hypothetical protein